MNLYFKTSDGIVIESWDLLLRIMLKICESDIVSAIGSFYFRGDDFDIRAPDVCEYDYIVDTDKEKKYELMSGSNAIENKLAGFYVLKEEEIRKYTYGNKIEMYIEAGLNGIRQGINRLKSLYNDLNSFDFTIPVIWEMSELAIFNYERNNIWANCDSKKCSISFNTFNEQYMETYNDPKYINHLNKIQKILDEVVAEKFEVRLKIEEGGRWFDPIEFGLLSKNEQGYYPVDDKTFKKALDRFDRGLLNRSQEETKRIMQRIDRDIAKYKELKREGNLKAKEKYERLQGLMNVMEAIKSYTDAEEKTNKGERNEKSD